MVSETLPAFIFYRENKKNINIMKKIYTTLFLSAIAVSSSFAQFNFNTNTNIGQVLSVDSVKGVGTFDVNFNTAKASSSWVYDGEGKLTVTSQKCQTQKGLQINVYESAESTAAAVINGDFECRDYGGNRNPSHVHSVDSLLSVLGKFVELNEGTADSVKNVYWKPAACLFDVNGDDKNQAFGAYPGMYKRVEYGFQFNFSGKAVQEDITFDIDTYYAGNTGKTASYTLTVAFGSATGVIATVDNFYVTGGGKKSVKLAEAIGKTPADFSNQKVYIFVKTLGTDTEISKETVDPIIVFDNIHVVYGLPTWIAPDAGILTNGLYNNSEAPAKGKINEKGLFGLNLQTSGRLGAFSITNNREDHYTKLYNFPEQGAVKANDGNGNYTVDVPYTLTPEIQDDATGNWSKEKIVIEAPASGTVNDDIMLFLEYTPKSTSSVFENLELDCGVRIFYEFYVAGDNTSAIDQIDNNAAAVYAANGKIYVENATETVIVRNVAGQRMAVASSDNAQSGIAVPAGVYLVTTGQNTTKILVK